MDRNLSKLQEIVKGREAWCTAIHGVAKSWTRLSDWTTAKKLLFWATKFAVTYYSSHRKLIQKTISGTDVYYTLGLWLGPLPAGSPHPCYDPSGLARLLRSLAGAPPKSSSKYFNSTNLVCVPVACRTPRDSTADGNQDMTWPLCSGWWARRRDRHTWNWFGPGAGCGKRSSRSMSQVLWV